MEHGWTQHSGRHNRHPQRGQRALNAMASGSSYQGPSRCRWRHPDSYSSDGNEHFGSRRQKVCPIANLTRSRETRTTNDRDEISSDSQIIPYLDIFDRYPLNGGRMLRFADHLSNEAFK